MLQKALTIIFTLFSFVVSSQGLDAYFTITDFGGNTITSGCQPLVIQFNDSSTFNGAPITYSSTNNGDPYNSHTWDFGLGSLGGSNLQNPSIAYSSADTVTVSLYVTNNGSTYDTFQRELIIHPLPTVDFSSNVQSGCDSLEVQFTNLSTSGSLPITNWTWDFSDGVISSDTNPTHTFVLDPQTNQNCFNITLIVVNSEGCNNSLTRNQYICIDPEPIADFAVDNRVLCDSPYVASFFDSSVSNNALAYLWRFGDNTTSNAQNPVHEYLNPGSYNIRLTVTDTTCGVSDIIQRNAYVRAQSIEADYTFNLDSVCAGTPINFQPNHQLNAGNVVNSSWNFGDGNNSNQTNPTHTYTDGGLYTTSVEITDNFGCSDTFSIDDSILIYPEPDVNFGSNVNQSCRAPFEVDFTSNVSPDVITYYWEFGDGDTSGLPNPTHIYTSSGNYDVSLTVYNDQGCSNTLTQSGFIEIEPTVVSFDVDTNLGCVPLTVQFTDNSTSNDPITSYSWNFDDPASGVANTSSAQNPSHIFNDPGTYDVTLTIETQSGCIGDYTLPINTGNTAFAAFSATPTSVCVNDPVSLTNNSNGNITSTTWSFGDGNSDNNPNLGSHVYIAPGLYDLTLSVGDNGCFSDSTIQIEVLDPEANFNYNAVCSTPGRFNFSSTGSGGTSFQWNFGDGNSGSGRNVSHTYASPGSYTVTLTVTDSTTGCTNAQSSNVVFNSPNVDFVANRLSGCAPTRVNFSNQSATGLTYLWNYGDPASGSNNTSTNYNGTHRYLQPGRYTVTLRVTDANGCQITETKTNYIEIYGANANFNAQQTFLCFDAAQSNTISFNDLSTGLVGTNIVEWTWYFGDNTTAQYSLPGNPPPSPVTHTYTSGGLYDVALTVTNDQGCTDSIMRLEYIDISEPNALFEVDFNLYCEGQSVPFINQSTGTGLSYFWDFGDNVPGDTSVLRNPQYIYSDTGTYSVTLSIEDTYGCTDTFIINNAVRIGTPTVDFTADDTFRYCPPHLVNFTNLSVYDTLAISSILWDFGDGTFSRRLNPSHIYTQSGLFNVSLYIEFANGCTDSLGFSDFINVGGAVGDIGLTEDTGCAPLCIGLDANSDGAVSHFWLYGDGSQQTGGDSMGHCYLDPGLFVPAVVLTDTQQPSCTYVLYSRDTVYSDSVTAYFTVPVDSICQQEALQLFDSSYAEINNQFEAWFWDFGDGNTDTVQDPVHNYVSGGQYTISLTAVNAFGCLDVFSRDIYVWEKVFADFNVSDSIGCDTLFTVFQDVSSAGDAPIVEWFWDFGISGISSDTFNGQFPNPILYQDTGNYTINLFVTDANGCVDTAQQTITVFPTPLGINDLDTVQLCLGDTMTLQGTPGYSNYIWSPGDFLSDSSIAQPRAFPNDTITYQLTTIDTTGCLTIDSITIEVLPRPTLAVQPYPDTAICPGDTVQLQASGSAVQYSWRPPSGLNSSLISDPLAYPGQTTTYTVTATDTNNCRNFDSVRVIVNQFTMDIIADRTCLGDSTMISDGTVTTDLPIATWEWTVFDDQQPNPVTFTDSAFNYFFTDSGTYTIELILTDIIGCTDTVVDSVIVDIPTQAFAEQDTIICFGQSTQLRGGGGEVIYWTPPVAIDNDSSYTPIVSPETSTQYVANLVNGVCPVGRDSVFVRVIPTPILEGPGTVQVLRGTSTEVEFIAENYDSVYWNPTDSIRCSDCLRNRVFPDRSTIYTISVIDTFGCVNQNTLLVEVYDECSDDIVFVPNTFTPNEDGKNDVAYARLYGALDINYFRIYDRWGQIVFESEDENQGWDGINSNGKKHNQGVYVYVVEAVCFNGETVLKTGNITLIK